MTGWLCAVSADEVKVIRQAKTMNKDDSNNDCYSYAGEDTKWAVIDLKKIYSIPKLKTSFERIDNRVGTLSFYVGDEFMPCSFYKQIKKYSPCKLAVTVTQTQQEIICDGKGVEGQYLAVVENLNPNKNSRLLNLCQLEVSGTKTSKTPKNVKQPTIRQTQELTMPKYGFKIMKAILKGVDSVDLPELCNAVDFVNENCQPIIYNRSNKRICSLACETPDGKGRIIISGKFKFLSDISKKTPGDFRPNLLKWLSSGNTNPNIIKSSTFNTKDDIAKVIKKGDIIDFEVKNPTSQPILDEIKSLLMNGTVGVNVDNSIWEPSKPGSRESYLQILDIFNVDMNTHFANYNSKDKSTLSEKDFNDDFLGLEERFRRLSVNHEYLLKHGLDICESLQSTPFNLLVKSKIKSYLEDTFKRYEDLLKWICPCKPKPTKDVNERIIVGVMAKLMKSQLLVNSGIKFPCVDSFPGDFSKPVNKKTVKISIDNKFQEVLSPTGAYLEAGSTVAYKILTSTGSWKIRIGCQTDVLNENRAEWIRLPEISIDVPLTNKKGSFYSPYGGNLWLVNEKANQSITITLKGVVKTPFFNVKDPQMIEKWNKEKTNKGLWAQIAGDNMDFCVDSNKIRSFDGKYLRDNLRNQFDKLVRMDHELKAVDWRDRRQDMIVFDVQTSVGSLHSGYPISSDLIWFDEMFNVDFVAKQGNWGACHEMGHNMQDDVWTIDGSREVTTQIFCMLNYEKLWHLPYFGLNNETFYRKSDAFSQIKSILDEGPTYEKWKSNEQFAILTYGQMIIHFGWGFYQKVFKYYRDNQIKASENKDRILLWMNITSTISGHNLLPLYDFWGWPYIDEMAKSLSHLPCFFPEDMFTTTSQTRRSSMEQKYKTCEKKSRFYEDIVFKILDLPVRPNNINITFV